MGSASSVLGTTAALRNSVGFPKIYCPPQPPSYSHSRQITMLNTIDGNQIACRMFSPFLDAVDSLDNFRNLHKTVIFSHGNADDIGTAGSYCQWIADSLCCNVVAYDYANYGVSSKTVTTEDNMNHSIEAVFGFLTASVRVPPQRIFVFGKSLGSVPSLFLASQPYGTDIAGVILVSPLASGARVLLRSTRFPNSIMSTLDDLFAPNIRRIARVKSPVLLVHGTKDSVVSIQNSHDLYSHIPHGLAHAPLWVEADHNDIESLYKGLFVSTIQAFMLDHAPDASISAPDAQPSFAVTEDPMV